jgi:hypothetical protein
MAAEVFVEEWQAQYGSPMLISGEDLPGGTVELAEELPADGSFALRPAQPAGADRVAFVDGVRRGDAHLYVRDGEVFAHGVAGAHACGAALCDGQPRVDHVRVERMIIWGGGMQVVVPALEGGWQWHVASIHDNDADAPLRELQNRMRQSEAELAEGLAAQDWLVVADGPLSFVRSRDLPVCGYVKTHHRPLLPPELHKRVPELGVGERTPLFAMGRERYSCYTRIASGLGHASPWHAIARLEFPQSAGLDAARTTAERITNMLPRYAGIAHTDPRAPQNLQPIAALERQLRHRLGHPGLSTRAIRGAARNLALSTGRSPS